MLRATIGSGLFSIDALGAVLLTIDASTTATELSTGVAPLFLNGLDGLDGARVRPGTWLCANRKVHVHYNKFRKLTGAGDTGVE